MRRSMKLAGVALAGVLGVSALAAWGGGSTGTATISAGAVQTAATNAQAAESRQYSFTITGTAGGKNLDVNGTVLAAGDGSRAQATIDLGDKGTIEALVVDHDAYVSVR